MPRYLLFPGRHHLLTRFQADYLHRLATTGHHDDPDGDHAAADGVPTATAGDDPVTVVWAVTSANHENTRRNPVPYHRREAAIERFSVLAGLRSVVVPVFDTAATDRFAEVTLKNVAATAGLELTPANTVVACSTPQVAAMYERAGVPDRRGGGRRRARRRPGRGTCCCGWPPTTRRGGNWPTRRPSTCTTATASTTWSARWSTTRWSATRAG